MRALRVGAAALAVMTLAGAMADTARGSVARACGSPAASRASTRAVLHVLASGRDVWGEKLLAARAGPTYEQARKFLPPLLFARGPHEARLTDSGVYYVPLADPPRPAGADVVALHVADGSQLIARRVGGKTLTVLVGANGRERYGACLGRLAGASLLGGYLPVLETGYVDASGTRYRQESFATRLSGGRSLASVVELRVDARKARSDATVRFVPSEVEITIPRGAERNVDIAWDGATTRTLDRHAYVAARDRLVDAWKSRLAEGMQVTVPERRVENAERALLVQDLLLSWRYSVGNSYEELSFPEAPALAGVMGEQGFGDVERAILEASLSRPSSGYASWKRGERLLASALYYRRFRDRAYVESATPTLATFVSALDGALRRERPAILARERFSSDIPDAVYGTHAQTVAWAGLRAMGSVWAATGHAELAARSRRLAAQLEPALRAAVRASERRLPDGSLFVPARLLDREMPYSSLVQARAGSYWNLVMPFALSSGFFAPGGKEANGIVDYLQRHGSRLLGLVRAGAYALYGRTAPFPVSGTDQVYGVDVSRFLADNDRPDQLVLTLYGQLAAGMTPGTFVAGEGASVAPLDGRLFRAMYLPPNSESNAAFLETLRLLLVHETIDVRGEPDGLELAYATPRRWLRRGGRIAVERAPTSFGPLSFSITAARSTAHIRIDVPRRGAPRHLSLRLRLPPGDHVVRVEPFGRLDDATGTIDLSGRRGRLELDVQLARS